MYNNTKIYLSIFRKENRTHKMEVYDDGMVYGNKWVRHLPTERVPIRWVAVELTRMGPTRNLIDFRIMDLDMYNSFTPFFATCFSIFNDKA